MGKAKARGRPALDLERHLRRGTWRGVKRLKESRRKVREFTPTPYDLTDDELTAICFGGDCPERSYFKRTETGIPGYDPLATAPEGSYFDLADAHRACSFFYEQLSFIEGQTALKSFILQPWQIAIVGNLFGWKNEDETRRYRTALVYIPRKNGKTPLAAGIINYMLLEDREPGAQIYGAAGEYKQASLVWRHAANMLRQNPQLVERVQIFKGQSKAIELCDHEANVDNVGIYRVICADASSQQGLNTSAAVLDELHTQPNRDLWDALRRSMSTRQEPLLIAITTADYAREGSICNEIHAYAKQVRDGLTNDETFLPVIYEADPANWKDEDEWYRSNPNLGVSKSVQYMRRELKMAESNAAEANKFKRYELNILTEAETQWIPLEVWDRCADPVPVEQLLKRTCFAGMDLAATTDTTALVFVWPDDDNGYYILPHFWIPADDIVEREKRDRVEYRAWAQQGYITLTPGGTTDYNYLRHRLVDAVGTYKLKAHSIGYDATYANPLINAVVKEDGVKEDTFIEMRQGWRTLSEPTKHLERLAREGRLHHGGHPVLRHQINCVALGIDESDNYRLKKNKSTGRIDGVVALVMAIGRATAAGRKRQSYEGRGMKFI